jgi:hypothetical protein
VPILAIKTAFIRVEYLIGVTLKDGLLGLMCHRLTWLKIKPGTNTLAYFVSPIVTKKKVL